MFRITPADNITRHWCPHGIHSLTNHPSKTQDVESMLAQGWSSLVDGEPTWGQHWFNVLCLLGSCDPGEIPIQRGTNAGPTFVAMSWTRLVTVFVSQDTLPDYSVKNYDGGKILYARRAKANRNRKVPTMFLEHIKVLLYEPRKHWCGSSIDGYWKIRIPSVTLFVFPTTIIKTIFFGIFKLMKLTPDISGRWLTMSRFYQRT